MHRMPYGYKKQRAGKGGWVCSPSTGVEMRAVRAGRLAVRIAGDDATREDLPED